MIQPDRHPGYLGSRIESFLVQMKEKLRSMSEDEFKERKYTLALDWTKKNQRNLDEESSRFWGRYSHAILTLRKPTTIPLF